MKYYVYSYIWRRPVDTVFNTGCRLWRGGVIGLFEHITRQPEKWAITSIVEVSKEDYEAARVAGILDSFQ